MLSPTIKHRTIRYQSFFMLISVVFSLSALVTTTSSHVATPQGKPIPGNAGKPTAGNKYFQIKQGWPRPGTNDPERPVIKVTAKKNKQVYDTVDAFEGGLRYLIQVRGQCGPKGTTYHLGSNSVDLYNGTKLIGSDTFPVDKSHRSIGANHGEGWNYYTVNYPYSHPRTNPIAACNDALKDREGSQGQQRAALLQHGFNVEVVQAYDAELNLSCLDDPPPAHFEKTPFFPKDRTPLSAQIRCMPTGYVPTTGAPSKPGVHLDPHIKSVVVTPEPAEMKGHACPVYVGFRGRITAGENRPGDDAFKVKYRFIGDRGFSTSFYEETLRKGEIKSVFWKRRIEALPIAGGTDKVMIAGVKPKLPIYQGWTILQVLYPVGSFSGKTSEKATFTVDCNPPPQRTAPPRGPKQ